MVLTGGVGLTASRNMSNTSVAALLQESLQVSLQDKDGAIHKSLSAMF